MDGKELRETRQWLGLSQAQFGEQLGITKNSVARQERGEMGISEPVARLARLLLKLRKLEHGKQSRKAKPQH